MTNVGYWYCPGDIFEYAAIQKYLTLICLKKLGKTTKHGGKYLTVESDKASIFILKAIISNTEDSKACLLRSCGGMIRLAIIRNTESIY